MRCSKCGEETPANLFTHSGTICDDCWAVHDMDRFREVRPKTDSVPVAKCAKLTTGIGVLCPHCDHKVMRKNGYFHKQTQIERCPKCMNHYKVKKGEAI